MDHAVNKFSCGVIGVGAFGTLLAKHVAPLSDMVLYDAAKDLSVHSKTLGARVGTLADVAQCDVVVLAVPVQKMEEVLTQIAPLLKAGALVIDVASVKVKIAALMARLLPDTVDIVAAHPLFGPQSGKNGIANLKLVVCPVRGQKVGFVRRFCRKALGLKVFMATPEEHDREMAYVQGLTHLLAKVVVKLDVPKLRFTTKTYELMEQMVDMVRYDSDDLFRAIQRENPFSKPTEAAFFDAAAQLEKYLDVGKAD